MLGDKVSIRDEFDCIPEGYIRDPRTCFVGVGQEVRVYANISFIPEHPNQFRCILPLNILDTRGRNYVG